MIHRRGTRIRAARAPRSTSSTERSQSFQTARLAEHSPGSCRPPPGAPGPIALCLPVRGLLCAGGVDVYGFCRRRTQPKPLPSSHGTRTYEIGVIHPHRHVVHIGLQISIQEGGVHSAPVDHVVIPGLYTLLRSFDDELDQGAKKGVARVG